MVQVGDFQFGRENRSIRRNPDPLLLAWPLNNLWDTNFAISQEGRMHFHYELAPFDKFDVKEAYRMCVQATSLCAVGASVSCLEEREWNLLQVDSEYSVPVVIRPWPEGGILMAVKNESGQESSCTVTVPGTAAAHGGKRSETGGRFSALAIDQENVILETMKPAEDGSGDMILRLYESKKSAVEAGLTLQFSAERAWICDMLENVTEEIPVRDGKISLSFRAFEIRTLRIKREDRRWEQKC